MSWLDNYKHLPQNERLRACFDDLEESISLGAVFGYRDNNGDLRYIAKEHIHPELDIMTLEEVRAAHDSIIVKKNADWN